MALMQWTYKIQYGPEGEENYAFVYDAEGALVSNLRIHHARAVVEAMNRRTPEPDEARPVGVTDDAVQHFGEMIGNFLRGHGWTGFGPKPEQIREFLQAALTASPVAEPRQAQVQVEPVEMVDWSEGCEKPAEPIWRIVLNEYCADFPSEGAARNFAAQISALTASPVAETTEAEVERALEPFAWIGQWLFARDLPDDTPLVTVEGAGKPFHLTRGMFKAAHTAIATLRAGGRAPVDSVDSGH